MTRGQKGCYIYYTNKETGEYFKSRSLRTTANTQADTSTYFGLIHPVVSFKDAKPFDSHVPIFDLEVAAVSFSDYQDIEEYNWVEIPSHINATEDMFVARVVGGSMNRRIINGSWYLFKANPGGRRNGKIVLVQHREVEDPDHGGSYTIKTYRSEKVIIKDEAINQQIVLSPDTRAFGYRDIMIDNPNDDLRVIGRCSSSDLI